VLSLPPAVRVFICTMPADMRKSFDSLAALTREVIRQDPMSGHLFVFRNRSGDRTKVLWWDRSGYCLWYKRLEEGVFKYPCGAGPSAEVESAELALLLEGIELADARRRKRFVPRLSQDFR
jgi:transposase